jgi:hypothetical protein
MGFTVGVMLTILPHTTPTPQPVAIKAPAAAQIQPIAIVSPLIMQEWTRVMNCETGSWTYPGPYYQGGLGITPWNWQKFGGEQFAPFAYEATPAEQVFVAERIQGENAVPDQEGICHNW